MKKILALVALTGLSTLASFATTVTYQTVGSELCNGGSGCGVNTQTVGSVIVTFNVLNTDQIVNALPTTIGALGVVDFDCALDPQDVNGTGCASQSVNGLVLNILVTQTTPVGGQGTIVGSFSGTMSGTTSLAFITWTTPTINIGPISYTALNNAGNQLALSPPSTDNGRTSINALITDNTVPEPSTYAMLGTALLGLGFLRRRKA